MLKMKRLVAAVIFVFVGTVALADLNNTTTLPIKTAADGSAVMGVGITEIAGTISTDNSSIAILGTGGVYTGTAEEITNYAVIFVNVKTDVASATDGLAIEQSSDGTNWDHDDVYTVPAGGGKNYSINPYAGYMRVVYTNGAAAQTYFRLQVILKPVNAKPSSHRIQDAIIDDDDAELVKAVLSAKANGDGFVNISATESNNLRVTDAESIFAIAKGDVVGHSIVYKFGKHEDVGTTFEPLSIGGVYQTPQVSGATTLRVKAGNTNDTAGGSGARLITIQGLDETGALATESLPTSGTSAGTAGTVTWLRVFRAFVAESGTYATAGADSCAADIVIETTGGVAWLTIDKPDICRAQSQIGQYTVPLGKTAYVSSYLLTTDSNKAVDFVFFMRGGILDTAPPYQAKRTVVEEIGVQGHLAGSFNGGEMFPELTDIGWMVKAAAAAEVTVDFQVVLVDN